MKSVASIEQKIRKDMAYSTAAREEEIETAAMELTPLMRAIHVYVECAARITVDPEFGEFSERKALKRPQDYVRYKNELLRLYRKMAENPLPHVNYILEHGAPAPEDYRAYMLMSAYVRLALEPNPENISPETVSLQEVERAVRLLRSYLYDLSTVTESLRYSLSRQPTFLWGLLSTLVPIVLVATMIGMAASALIGGADAHLLIAGLAILVMGLFYALQEKMEERWPHLFYTSDESINPIQDSTENGPD